MVRNKKRQAGPGDIEISPFAYEIFQRDLKTQQDLLTEKKLAQTMSEDATEYSKEMEGISKKILDLTRLEKKLVVVDVSVGDTVATGHTVLLRIGAWETSRTLDGYQYNIKEVCTPECNLYKNIFGKKVGDVFIQQRPAADSVEGIILKISVEKKEMEMAKE